MKTIKSQLQQQIYQYENATRIVGHKDSEIQRLMNESQSKDYELSRLQLHCQALEVGLAASSATAVQQSASAERHESLEMRGAMSTMMEAIQSFSSRVDHVESRNLTDSLPVRHCLCQADPPDPGDWDDEGGGADDDRDDEDAELVPDVPEDVVRENVPDVPEDVVDARALQNARIDPLPNNAAE